jgi:hypothetical protein
MGVVVRGQLDPSGGQPATMYALAALGEMPLMQT